VAIIRVEWNYRLIMNELIVDKVVLLFHRASN